ncbi:MAG: hypothetical protein ACXVDH_00645 [Nocardioides sp.]
MSEQDKGPVRPQQVTFAGLAVIGGSLVLLIAAFDQINTLHSLDTRNAVEQLINDQPSGLGITVEGWLRILKVVGMITGACAAAAAILGWQTLQRSRTARIVLPVVALPMVIAGLAIEPLFAVVVAIAVVILWLPTASAWFDPDKRGRAPAVIAGPPPPASPAQHELQHLPPPYAPPSAPSPYAYPPPQHPSPYPAYVAPSATLRRPGAVTAAAVITFVLAGITAALGVVLAVVGGSMAPDMMDELDRRGYDTSQFTDHELAVGFAFLGALVASAAAVAIVAAVLVLRRSPAARVVLTVMSGLCIALSVAAVTSGISLITLAGAIAVIVLLHRGASKDWFAGRNT